MNRFQSACLAVLLVMSIDSHAQLSLSQNELTGLSLVKASWNMDFRRLRPFDAVLDVARQTRTALTISVVTDTGTKQARVVPVANRVLSYGLLSSLLLSLTLVMLGLRDALKE